jgi:hypothetical protein
MIGIIYGEKELIVHYKINFYVRFRNRLIQDMTYAHVFSHYRGCHQRVSFCMPSLLLLRDLLFFQLRQFTNKLMVTIPFTEANRS